MSITLTPLNLQLSNVLLQDNYKEDGTPKTICSSNNLNFSNQQQSTELKPTQSSTIVPQNSTKQVPPIHLPQAQGILQSEMNNLNLSGNNSPLHQNSIINTNTNININKFTNNNMQNSIINNNNLNINNNSPKMLVLNNNQQLNQALYQPNPFLQQQQQQQFQQQQIQQQQQLQQQQYNQTCIDISQQQQQQLQQMQPQFPQSQCYQIPQLVQIQNDSFYSNQFSPYMSPTHSPVLSPTHALHSPFAYQQQQQPKQFSQFKLEHNQSNISSQFKPLEIQRKKIQKKKENTCKYKNLSEMSPVSASAIKISLKKEVEEPTLIDYQDPELFKGVEQIKMQQIIPKQKQQQQQTQIQTKTEDTSDSCSSDQPQPQPLKKTPSSSIEDNKLLKSKYQNFNKLFMLKILNIFTVQNMKLLVNLDEKLQKELINYAQAIKQTGKRYIQLNKTQENGKKVLTKKVKIDYFQNAHYLLCFLQINQNSLPKILQNPKLVELHNTVFQLDLTQNALQNQHLIRKINFIKQAFYTIVSQCEKIYQIDGIDRNSSNYSQTQVVIQYSETLLSKIKQMNDGQIILRFS